VAEFVLTI